MSSIPTGVWAYATHPPQARRARPGAIDVAPMRIGVLAFLLLLGAPSVAHAQSRLVVGFEHPIGEAARSALLERVGADHEQAILRRLRELPGVAFAELDRRVGLGRPVIGARQRLLRGDPGH